MQEIGNPGSVSQSGSGPLGSGRTQRLFSWPRRSGLLVRGGRVVDPSQHLDQVTDLLVVDGRIAGLGLGLLAPEGTPILDAHGLVVAPGLVDVHVHLRDPGFPEKETLETGAAAAAAGGFTTICCMPNTTPPLDTPEAVESIVSRARELPVRVYPIGAISLRREGNQLADLDAMAEAGAIGFSDDGDSTRDSRVMWDALVWSSRRGLPIMAHCEDRALAGDGVMHEGAVSRELRLPGIPSAAEEVILLRDLELARATGGWLHVLHLTTARGRAFVRAAKREGVRVTAEVMPHHLLLTHEWVAGRRRFVGERDLVPGPCPDPNAKVNPPLRTEADALDLLAGLRDGTLDIVATDHAPHSERDKPADLTRAAFGMVGLELALPLMLRLVTRGELTFLELIDLLSTRPSTLFGLPGGTLRPGSPADVVVFDPNRHWQVERATLVSRSCNTPLLGMRLAGRAVLTMVGGRVVYAETESVSWRTRP